LFPGKEQPCLIATDFLGEWALCLILTIISGPDLDLLLCILALVGGAAHASLIIALVPSSPSLAEQLPL